MIRTDVTQRFDILRALFELSHEQRDALAADDIEQFIDILERREALIDEFQSLQPFSGDPDNVIPFPGTVRPSTPVESDDSVALQGLLRAVLHIDEENEDALQRKLDEIRLALQETGRAKVTARSYRPVASAVATAVDRIA